MCKDIRAHFDSWDPKVTKFQYYKAKNWEFLMKSKQYCDYSTTESWSPGYFLETFGEGGDRSRKSGKFVYFFSTFLNLKCFKTNW